MKNTVRCLIVLAFTLSVSFAEAQVIGKENLVLKKNIFLGFKGGASAMDMKYSYNESVDKENFINKTALFKAPLGCWTGGFFVERTLPGWSYGIEFNLNHLYATEKIPDNHNDPNSNKNAENPSWDSVYFANIRIPVKLKFLEDDLFSPYLFMAPEIGTYISDSIAGSIPVYSYSSIDGAEEEAWGPDNARKLNLNLVAGAGVEGKIQIGLYEIRARFEAGYRLGLLSTTPKYIQTSTPDPSNSNDPNATTPQPEAYPFKRMMRGWEATIGLAFPLFINPSYSWMN